MSTKVDDEVGLGVPAPRSAGTITVFCYYTDSMSYRYILVLLGEDMRIEDSFHGMDCFAGQRNVGLGSLRHLSRATIVSPKHEK